MSPRVILFDAVGTLIEPAPPVAVVYQTVAASHGARLDEAFVADRFHNALAAADWSGPTSGETERLRWREIVTAVFAGVDLDISGLFEDLWNHFADYRHWRVFGDVSETWHWLEQRGYIVGIATNFDQRFSRIASHLEPLARARYVFCSAELGHSKPSSNFYRSAEQRLGCAAAEIVMVGDDWSHDVAGPRSAGWQAIHVDRHRRGQHDESIRSLQAITALLDSD